MMKRLILLLAIVCIPASATVAVVQAGHGTGTSVTLGANTTIGNGLLILVSSSTAHSGTVKIGTQTLTLDGACAPQIASIDTCAFYTANITVASTAAGCTAGCGTGNAIVAVEFSGVAGIEPVIGCQTTAGSSVCQQSKAGAIVGLVYNPGYSSEGVVFLETCNTGSGSPTVAGMSGGSTANDNSNPSAWGVTSGTTAASMAPTSGCNASAGVAAALYGTGATQQPIHNPNMGNFSTAVTSGSATVTAQVFNVGDLVTIHPWCISSCGVTTLTLGSQSATCPAGAQGTTNANAGQPGICYVYANAKGALTVTFTPSGSPTQFQVDYRDYTVSANTTSSFDTAATANCSAAPGSCSEGGTVTTPSITPTNTGSLLENFVSTHGHASNPTGSWTCLQFFSAGGNSCQTVTTINQNSWILSSSAGATAASTPVIVNNDSFQSIVAAFGAAAPAANKRHRAYVVNNE